MRRHLVVAHQTLDSPELMDTIRDRMAQSPSIFHLVVPESHGEGRVTWEEGEVRLAAERRLEAILLLYAAEGIPANGEVGDHDPVYAVDTVLRRQGPEHYDEIIVSTLPARISKWLGRDAPTRLAKLTDVPVTHVETADVRV
jgi:GABA permease